MIRLKLYSTPCVYNTLCSNLICSALYLTTFCTALSIYRSSFICFIKKLVITDYSSTSHCLSDVINLTKKCDKVRFLRRYHRAYNTSMKVPLRFILCEISSTGDLCKNFFLSRPCDWMLGKLPSLGSPNFMFLCKSVEVFSMEYLMGNLGDLQSMCHNWGNISS